MHVLISALPFAAFIIKAVKTDTAGGGGSLPSSSLRSLWIRRAAFGGMKKSFPSITSFPDFHAYSKTAKNTDLRGGTAGWANIKRPL